jgi:uncharacterized membrane protein
LSFKVKNYLRTMAPSFLILILIAYGMATHNIWIQFGGVLLVLGIQMGYQVYKGVKSGPALEANVKEAARARRLKALHYVSEVDVRAAQMAAGSSGQRSEIVRMVGMIAVPLGIFFGATFLIERFWPGTPAWQSYVVAFLLSMPVSAVFMARSGLPSGAPRVTPSSYLVTERGIVFDQMGRSFILKFPLVRAEKGKDMNSVEVEGVKENDLIPYRLKLCTDKVDELLRILAPRVKAGSSS